MTIPIGNEPDEPTSPIDPTGVNMTLDAEFGNTGREWMSSAEWERRLDDAAYAVTKILNAPVLDSEVPQDE